MNVYRLQQLADALRRVDEYKWRFDINGIIHPCGTAGCAIGLCSKLWPEDFILAQGFCAQTISLRARQSVTSFCAVAEFFEITPLQSLGLFAASQNPPNASAAHVAASIDALIAPHVVTPPVMFKAPERGEKHATPTASEKP